LAFAFWLRSYFWPFTDVLREIWPAVTEKFGKTADYTDVTEGFLAGRWHRRPTIWMPDSVGLHRLRSGQARVAPWQSFWITSLSVLSV